MIDIGCHKGKYFDLFSKFYRIKKAVLIEPQIKYFNYLRKKYKSKKILKFLIMLFPIKMGLKLFILIIMI